MFIRKAMPRFYNVILWILVIVHYMFITSLSATPADKSAVESKGVVEIIDSVSQKVFMKSDVPKDKITQSLHHKRVRKLAHVINYLIFGFLNAMLWFKLSNKSMHRTTVFTLFFGLCGAIMDETIQLFFDGRSAEVLDVLIDFDGTCLGVVVFLLLSITAGIISNFRKEEYRYEII